MAGIEERVPTPCQPLLMELPFYEVGDWLLGTTLPRHNSPFLPGTDAQLQESTDSSAWGAGTDGTLLAESLSGCYQIVRQSLQGRGSVWMLSAFWHEAALRHEGTMVVRATAGFPSQSGSAGAWLCSGKPKPWSLQLWVL